MSDRWLCEPYDPVAVDDVTLAFPASVRHLMPTWEAIPDEYKRHAGNDWVSFASRWFGEGLPENVVFNLKENIDGETATRHLHAILGSYEPKHEHKIGAVAYLASLWMDSVTVDE